jgi:hypothetical protein
MRARLALALSASLLGACSFLRPSTSFRAAAPRTRARPTRICKRDNECDAGDGCKPITCNGRVFWTCGGQVPPSSCF